MSSWVQGAERFRRSNILGWWPLHAWCFQQPRPAGDGLKKRLTCETTNHFCVSKKNHPSTTCCWGLPSKSGGCLTDRIHNVGRINYTLSTGSATWQWHRCFGGCESIDRYIWLQTQRVTLERHILAQPPPARQSLKSMCSFGHPSSHSPLAAPPASAWRFWIFMLTSTMRKAPIQIHCPSLLACGVWTFLMVTIPNSAS